MSDSSPPRSPGKPRHDVAMKRSRALALAVALVAATTLASASHRSAADLTSRLVDSLPLSARGGGDPVPEAVLLAVHVRQSTNDTDSVERLAARAIADVDGRGLTFATRDCDVERRVVDARVVFENDASAPLTFARLNDVLGLRESKITPEKLVEASRAAERAHVGASFDVFSGVYGAAVKTTALRWLSQSATHENAWVIEPDVAWTGEDWVSLFERYYDDGAVDVDLVTVNATIGDAKKMAKWPHYGSCEFCREGDGVWQRAFLPVFRVSKRLATAVIDALKNGTTGHHEAFIPTVCSRAEWCTWVTIKETSAWFRYRPVLAEAEVGENGARDKLYHPIKDPVVYRALRNATSDEKDSLAIAATK